jgi:hypothetical protein
MTFLVPAGVPTGFAVTFSNQNGFIIVTGVDGNTVQDTRRASNPAPNTSKLYQVTATGFNLYGEKA